MHLALAMLKTYCHEIGESYYHLMSFGMSRCAVEIWREFVMQQSKRRILVIDDDAFVRESLTALLRKDGYLATEASSGAQGIELALRAPPHMILCDLLMPGIDGFGVLARVRAEPSTAAIPFVFITSSTDPGDSRLGFQLGANDYLVKPIDCAMLSALVRERLGQTAGTTVS
jgi:CheY-like chemotaxis protein